MAAFNGLIEVQLLSHYVNGQEISNTFHVADSSAGAPPDYAELLLVATQLDTWLGTVYRTVLDTGSTMDSVICRQVSDPTSPVVIIEAIHPVNAAGSRNTTNNNAPLPVCGLVSFKTPNASRRFRGHNFLPPVLDTTALAGSSFAGGSAYVTAVNNYVAKLQAGAGPTPTWTGSSLANYILSCYSHRAAELGDPSVAEVQQVARGLRPRWLRSRERGTT